MATRELDQFLEDIDEKVLECTICFNRLQNPKSLNCPHTFCLACLEDWVKENGKLTCPTCKKSQQIPKGGLQKLAPNIILNNLLETMERYEKRYQMKCVCEKQAKYYCQDCEHYLCISCSDHHKMLPVTEYHNLHSVKLMTRQEFALLHPRLCKDHKEHLEFYCTNCRIPICARCMPMHRKECGGIQKPIKISEAFQNFKETATELKKEADDFKDNLQMGLEEVRKNSKKLEQSKATSLRDIDNHVQQLRKKITEDENKMIRNVETMYRKKKEISEIQINGLSTTISDVNTKLKVLNQLLKSDEATAMQSCDIVTELKDTLREQPPKTKPNDNGKIVFLKRTSLLQEYNIGHVTQEMAACLRLMQGNSVTQGQQIVVKVNKTSEFEIDASKLKATWTQPTGETDITPVKEDNNGNYFVTRKCTSPGVCSLDVSIDDEPIKQSPVKIKVERKGLVNTIQIRLKHGNVSDVVKYEYDCLLISSLTNELHKYKQSGEYVTKVKLPKGVEVNRMYVMKNGDIAFSDKGNKCIAMMQREISGFAMMQTEKAGHVVGEPIGQGALSDPQGIHVDESSNIVYVADMGKNSCVFMFKIDSGQQMRRIWSHRKSIDVTFTRDGNLILLNNISNPSQNIFGIFSKSPKLRYKPVLKLFDKEGEFLKGLGIGLDSTLMNSQGVVVDEDGNIIISSEHKLQLFSNKGYFIERLDKEEDEILNPLGLSIISYHPRRFAVADKGNNTVKIFNY
ncbi:tripartite motif-containing protein 2-like [Anneissia japonica]|uniref:tripartite motif-containing protein 2-like n=1 Tax=Anneissia japonica TaxID=1529436 RepID=UPI0014257501|nr:tripartite motif-containing protein 2-like [Anneissia japonica]